MLLRQGCATPLVPRALASVRSLRSKGNRFLFSFFSFFLCFFWGVAPLLGVSSFPGFFLCFLPSVLLLLSVSLALGGLRRRPAWWRLAPPAWAVGPSSWVALAA